MLDFPINNYPTKAETDPEVLYRSLGTFWTNIFQDKLVLRGYTTALAEEIIQRYYDLTEVVNSYSVKDVPIFHKEKWKPILVYKSKFGSEPFVFEQGKATFGPQSENDVYYRDVVFQFGFPKRPTANVYIVNVGDDFKDFGVIADKIFSPSRVFMKGTDVVLIDGTLYFNYNIFDDPNIARMEVIGENGQVETFIDVNGNTQNEELIILWAYHAELDQNILFNNFGYIFNLHLDNDQFFKDILKAVFDLHVAGPTVANIKTICASFMGIKPITESEETVVEIFTDSRNQFVVTDHNVYKFELEHTLRTDVVVGKTFFVGDILVSAVEYYDNVQTPGWWKSSMTLNNKLALSQYLFLGDYEKQLVFPNELDLITLDAAGNIVFPVEGVSTDVAQFNAHLNSDTVNKAAIKAEFNLINAGDAAPIQPVDFLMENFLKMNTIFLKFQFISHNEQSKFLALLPILRAQLPPYVYIIFGLDLQIDTESYENLNDATVISFDTGDLTLNSDGSNSTGQIENLAPYGYRDVETRLFAISLSIPDPDYEIVGTESGTADPSFNAAKAAGRVLTMKDGAPLHAPTAGESTQTFSKLVLLDFT